MKGSFRDAWTVEPMRPSVFGSLVGDERQYRVRLLVVAESSDDVVRLALSEVLRETLRLAPENLTSERNIILFAWDGVYSLLTVTYTDAPRRQEGPDVLKLSCQGWDREQQALGVRKARAAANHRETFIESILSAKLRVRRKRLALTLSMPFEVRIAFTADVQGTSFDELVRVEANGPPR